MTKDGRALSLTAGQIFSVFFAVSLFPVCKLSAKELQPASLSAAAKYSANHRGLSLLVIQHGRTLFEQSAETPRRIYSGTKAFWNLAALAAAQDRLLDLDQPVADTIAQWRDDPRKARVTIRQLLDFSAGLAPAFYLHENDAKDRDSTAIKLPLVAEPGSAFIYGPSALQVFYEVLKNKLRDGSPTRYLERRVLRRLGLGPQRYLLDRAGNPLLAAGWELSARQWAKLGKLVLDGGAPVVSRASLAQSWRGSQANSRFLVRLVEQSRGAGRKRNRFRKHARSANGSVKTGVAPVSVATRLTTLSPASAPASNVFTSFHRWKSSSYVTARGGRFSDAAFLRLLAAVIGIGVGAGGIAAGAGMVVAGAAVIASPALGVAIMSEERLGCH